MKKIKKELKQNNIRNIDPTFTKARFVDVSGRSLSITQSTHTEYRISHKCPEFGYTKSRHSFKGFWYPTKLKYRYVGKSYRVRVKQNVMFLRFNKAHITTLMHSGNKLDYFKNKGFWLRMWKSPLEVNSIKKVFKLLRPRNIFTSRGVWSRGDFYLKKKGKVSGYR